MVDCEHEPYPFGNPDPVTDVAQGRVFIDCQDKIYLVCKHCAALWNGESWL